VLEVGQTAEWQQLGAVEEPSELGGASLTSMAPASTSITTTLR
jgi:hypothetical protein